MLLDLLDRGDLVAGVALVGFAATCFSTAFAAGFPAAALLVAALRDFALARAAGRADAGVRFPELVLAGPGLVRVAVDLRAERFFAAIPDPMLNREAGNYTYADARWKRGFLSWRRLVGPQGGMSGKRSAASHRESRCSAVTVV